MIDDEDEFLFGEEEDDVQPSGTAPPALDGPAWNVLIVDDEPEIHSVTRMLLRSMTFKGRPLRFLSAHSAAEARTVLAETPDIAVILLDVVMETEDAGLRLVQYVRHELGNRVVRIILRTGQPGQVPETKVIVDYDINDYKAKTELTTERLFIAMYTALRSYDDIMTVEMNRRIVEMNRRGLEKIICASSSLFQLRALEQFASGVLTQLSTVLGCAGHGILCAQMGDTAGRNTDEVHILAAAGRFEDTLNKPFRGHVDEAIADAVTRALVRKANDYQKDHAVLFFRTPDGREMAVYLHTGRPLSELDQRLIEVLCTNISLGLDNVLLYENLADLNRNLEQQVADRTRDLNHAKELFRGIIELAHDAIISVNESQRITLFNPAAERTFGYRAEEVEGKPLDLLLPPEVRASHRARVARFMTGSANSVAFSQRATLTALRRDGTEFPVEISISKLATPNGQVLTAVVRDVTERKAFEETLKNLANTDPLTGTSNRRHFLEAVEREFQRAQRYHTPITIAMVDADHFKRINDTFGHAAGDDVLRELVARCRLQLRPSDLLGRWGGEEFALLLPETDAAGGHALAARLREAIAARPVPTAAGSVPLTVSIGVATWSDDLYDFEKVLTAADVALYAAKARGRNRVEVALPDPVEPAA